MREIIQLVVSFTGSLGFAALFNIHGKKLWFAALGGCLSWAVYLAVEFITPSPYVCGFWSTVVRCTHVLSSSMSFPYGKIVTHFRWFVNGEFRYCITFSSACTSTATPSGTQWLSASFLLPCSPQKGSYRFRLSGILPSPSSTSSSLSGKVLLPESTELSQKPEIQLPAFYEFLPYILHTK